MKRIGRIILLCGSSVLLGVSFAVISVLPVLLPSCDSGDVITEIIECQLPPGHCQMDDEEFDAMFNALTLDAQIAYIEAWGQPQDQREGFVSQ